MTNLPAITQDEYLEAVEANDRAHIKTIKQSDGKMESIEKIGAEAKMWLRYLYWLRS